ncbi:MAG: DUF3604 domain-containing protein [Phenylobacterium sp.]|uniref:DUF3604 domain-containing protein n=1 Tax=Phenylobacterium sp. TaxID=1871053 RepID=UPI002735E2F4|nr:DUF3604 domain-containing protein [Phenylobacterium sp.]MDP3746676.1 DUF3604 domain-containing protein [Phenylobacterium sp.]
MALLAWLASPSAMAAEDSSYSRDVPAIYPNTVYWGDTHLHTRMSLDSNGMGNKALGPDDAYRFAKGELITAESGPAVKLQRPLDFLVVADHAENLGVMPRLEAGDPRLLNTKTGRRWYEQSRRYPLRLAEALQGTAEYFGEVIQSVFDLKSLRRRSFFWDGFTGKSIGDENFRHSVWSEVAATADRHNEPGLFTTFVGYEWTPDGIHRVVVFKDGAEKVGKILPFSAQDSSEPEALWSFLHRYEIQTGGEVIAIPHNSNVSDGKMFAVRDSVGRPIGRTYASQRSRWEPLLEVTQIKGDSETHPMLSPTDEFADYETWSTWSNPRGRVSKSEAGQEKKRAEYARSALKLGLAEQARLGTNPFKFGMIGSTDAHTALSAVAEDNYWGKFSLWEPSPHRLFSRVDEWGWRGWDMAAAGYAAVWATQNTREALFAAMKRRETYASTGPRMVVRLFGGWDYQPQDAWRPDLVKIGYAKGVPMGGDLTHAPKGKAPSFLIRAVKDPDGANLDRAQVIKGWRSRDGDLHEEVYNVALSDGRLEGRDGKAPPVGSTVDVKNASYTNSIGDPELAIVWTDPDFDPSELAFYYVRVIEIPTPRWTAYDAKVFKLKDIPPEVPMVTQERAYTSPIWYTPG